MISIRQGPALQKGQLDNVSETISPNTTIAQYSIVSKIGEGGMGEVYSAPVVRDQGVEVENAREQEPRLQGYCQLNSRRQN
jgi:hypothetical protein